MRLGVRGQEAERRVALEHRLVRAAEYAPSGKVVHDGHPADAGGLGIASHGGQLAGDAGRAGGVVELGDVDADSHGVSHSMS